MNKETLNKLRQIHARGANPSREQFGELIALAERTTSPVSQMTAHLAAIEEALKVMRDNGLDECYAFENAIEALAFMKEVAK